MGESEEAKERREKLRQESLKDIRGIVREELDKAFKESVIPGDYERCMGCGELKKIGKPCPYCEEPREPEEPTDGDDDLGLGGI